MEALILAVIITYAIKKAAEDAHLHWQGSKAANRRGTRGRPARQRAASAARHDARYWAHQVRGGFPQVRHGLVMGWHSGRIAQLEGAAERARAKTEHVQARARVAQAIREQRRRQAEVLEEFRRQWRAEDGEPEKPATQEPPQEDGRTYSWGAEGNRYHWPAGSRETAEHWAQHMSTGGTSQAVCEYPPEGGPGQVVATYANGALVQPPAPSTEGNPMSGDTTYRQQMAELEAIRDSAEQEVNSARRQLMTSRLDVLQNLGLDAASLAEAAAIDDALRAQEKAARQTLDAADAAIAGLSKRHGGIQEAVDDAPVDRPADPEFYQG